MGRARRRAHLHTVAFSPDGTQIVSGSGDTTARIWDTIPRSRRREQARAAERLRVEIAPLVKRLLDELGPSDAAARLRSDAELSDPERAAAMRVLLRLTLALRAAPR